MRIFISYSRDDKQWVYDLARALRDRTRSEVWWDQELIVSQKWWDELLNQVEASDCFLLILTPRYVGSVYCMTELEYGHALNKPILPLMVKPCDVPPFLSPIQYRSVEGRALSDVLLECAIGLGEIQANILRGRYPAPEKLPARPPVPKPKAADPENPFDLFNAAEEAALKGDMARAEKLFQKLKETDPEGFGLEACQRLERLRRQRDNVTAYLGIVQQVEARNLDGARVAWRVYARRYGIDYDPKGYAALLADSATKPNISLDPSTMSFPVPKLHPSIEVTDILPLPFIWCEVTKGYVTLEDYSHLGGTRGGRYRLAEFEIARYPVTNAQYQVFLAANDGYREMGWWEFSPEARKWRSGHARPVETAFEGDDLPRTNVGWYDAIAFSGWLSARTGMNLTLPTEQQWQRAAQGDDNRAYPWGEEFDETRCNCNSTRPTPVRLYEPEGASPFGVVDLCGNVLEWCLTEWGTDSIRLDTSGERVVRGGWWRPADPEQLRTTHRSRYSPDLHLITAGFRIART